MSGLTTRLPVDTAELMVISEMTRANNYVLGTILSTLMVTHQILTKTWEIRTIINYILLIRTLRPRG